MNALYILGGLLSVVALAYGGVDPKSNAVVVIAIGFAQLWCWR